MQVTINVRNPRVYFLEYDKKKHKTVLRSGFYKSQTNGESDKFYEVQGTHYLYSKVNKYNYFGTNKVSAMIECDRRNELDKK